MKIFLALIIGGIIGFTLAKDPQVSTWVVEQAQTAKKQLHEWTK
jgi:hypothetical protein